MGENYSFAPEENDIEYRENFLSYVFSLWCCEVSPGLNNLLNDVFLKNKNDMVLGCLKPRYENNIHVLEVAFQGKQLKFYKRNSFHEKKI